jgi:hypothetical protein
MRLKRVIPAAVLPGLITASLAGCSPIKEADVVDPSLDLYSAKAVAQKAELRFVEALPAKLVKRVDQIRKGSLLSCRGDRNYRWAGGVTVEIAEGSDVEELVHEIAGEFAGQRFTVRDVTLEGGLLVLQLRAEHAESYLIGPTSDGSAIDIDSFSPCFHLQGDESPHSYY